MSRFVIAFSIVSFSCWNSNFIFVHSSHIFSDRYPAKETIKWRIVRRNGIIIEIRTTIPYQKRNMNQNTSEVQNWHASNLFTYPTYKIKTELNYKGTTELNYKLSTESNYNGTIYRNELQSKLRIKRHNWNTSTLQI